MDIAGIAKNHQTNSTAAGKTSSKKSWKLTDSLREKIDGKTGTEFYIFPNNFHQLDYYE